MEPDWPARVYVSVDGVRSWLSTANFSTTQYLKLMLLTLAEQEDLGLLHRIVVVDNGSRDVVPSSSIGWLNGFPGCTSCTAVTGSAPA